LSGGEAWVEKDVYDVEAKPAAQSGEYSLRHTRGGIADESLRQMMQALLADRFQLKLRRETKTGDIYLLEKSGKTLQLKPTKYTENQPVQGKAGFSGEIEYTNGHWFVFDSSIPQLAKFASDYILHRPVVDRTGISGSFDYKDPDVKIPQEMDFQGSFPNFIQDVGLKLTSSKGPVETLVIEHAEKPSPN
jgi:uncharacterized protein (TIGR03435 family)